MKPKVLLLVLIVCLAIPMFANAQATFAIQPTPDPAVSVAAPQANADGELPNASGQRRLTMRERRDLGITWANVHKKAKELYQDGQITPDMSRSEIAALVFSRIASDNPQAFGDPQVDWDSILAFIEAILPLILQIIGLFSWVAPATGTMVAVVPFIAVPIRKRAA